MCAQWLKKISCVHLVPHISCIFRIWVSEALSPSWIILLVAELVLVEIQFIRVVRPVIPILEQKLVAEAY